MRTKKFLFAYYQLVAIGGWIPNGVFNSKSFLKKEARMMDMETGVWGTSYTELTLNINRTFEINKHGRLSVYDLEVLESCGFKPKNK